MSKQDSVKNGYVTWRAIAVLLSVLTVAVGFVHSSATKALETAQENKVDIREVSTNIKIIKEDLKEIKSLVR